MWFYGNGDELLNYYTNQQTYGWTSNPIYDRNKRNYFWGLSSIECDIKRIHSGIPKAIVDTITAIVGKSKITCNDKRLKTILEVNNFDDLLVNRYRPMTLVEGDACLKINVNPDLTNVPIVEYYGSEDWEPIYKGPILKGCLFKTYYKDKKNKNYVLIESRTLSQDGMILEYNLYQLGKKNELYKVNYDCVPELAGLNKEPQLIPVKKLFAVPTKYFFNPLRPDRGKSIYDGKLDFFDMYDEIWSQASQTNRVSTPVEYYPVDLLERTKDGVPILPNKYNRQFIATSSALDGDGKSTGKIDTTQPELNFDKYEILASAVLSNILIGLVSPSSLGIDIAKKDNADAQREKEKQSIFTRNNIIAQETKFIKDLCEQLLIMQDYIDNGSFIGNEYKDITVDYDEFANPAFESELQILGPAWNNGQISTERYAKLLWPELSDEERMKEIAWLDNNKQKDDIDLGALLGNDNTGSMEASGTNEEPVNRPQE